MNASISLSVGHRPAWSPWWIALLLPVLPTLRLVVACYDDAPGSFDLLAVVSLFQGLAGTALAIVLPLALRRLSWPWRKEIEQLRGAWVLAALLTQLPLLLAPDENGEPVYALLAICSALVAAIPFGTEFHHRTLSGLLSQPADRRWLWRRKLTVLGIALLLLAVFASLSLGAFPAFLNRRSTLWLVGMLLLIPAVALGSGPWWSLLARGPIPGTVFALIVPAMFLIGLSMLLERMRGWQSLAEIAPESWTRIDDTAYGILAGVVLPVYALATGILARRRWLRLETPDATAPESGAFFGGRLTLRPAAAAIPGSRRSALVALMAKETRLQTVTLGVALVVMVATLLYLRPSGPDPSSLYQTTQEYLAAAIAVFAPLAILLAGSTSIAEERRMGTLDTQVLLPLRRSVQWWVKVGFVFAVGVIMALCLWTVLPRANPGTTDSFVSPFLALMFGCAVLPIFASSASPNTLRALLSALGLYAVALILYALTVELGSMAITRAANVIRVSQHGEPDVWIAQAASLQPADLPALEAAAQNGAGRARSLDPALLLLGVIVLGFAGLLAWRHFAVPASPSGRRFVFQCLALFGIYLGGAVGVFAIQRHFATRQAQAEGLLQAHAARAYQARIPPAQLQVLQHFHRGQPLPLHQPIAVAIPVWTNATQGQLARPVRRAPDADLPLANRWLRWTFLFPLDTNNARLIVERGLLPPNLREALRVESGLERGADPDLPIGPKPALPQADAPFQMSPELMRRYGIQPPVAR